MPTFGASFAWPSEETLIIRTVLGGAEDTVESRVGRRKRVRRKWEI